MKEEAEVFFTVGFRPVINDQVMDEIYPTQPQALQRAFLFSKLAKLQPPFSLSTMFYTGQAKMVDLNLPKQ